MAQAQLATPDAVFEPAEGPISAEHRILVQESFQRIAPAAELVAQLFYRRLFDIAPEVRPMFGDDMEEQQRKLVSALRLAVSSLGRLDDVIPALKLLGSKHRTYGVEPVHYGAVGEALLWTLGQCLEDDFTSEIHDAWACVYTVLAEVMTAEA